MFCMSKTGLCSMLQACFFQWGYELKAWKLRSDNFMGRSIGFIIGRKKNIAFYLY